MPSGSRQASHEAPAARAAARRWPPVASGLGIAVVASLMGLPSPMEASSGERSRRLSLEDYRETASPEGSLGGPMPARVSSREDWSISTAPCLRSGGHHQMGGGLMLGIGIDFAEEFHVV